MSKIIELKDGKYIIDSNLLPDRYGSFKLEVHPRGVSPSASVTLTIYQTKAIDGGMFISTVGKTT